MTASCRPTLALLCLALSARCQVYEPAEYSRYCPDNNPCQPPSSHHVCEFFDSGRERKCTNYSTPLRFNDEHVTLMIDLVNKYRSDVALGIAKGKDGVLLPRGYGFLRMYWDKTLAGLSQLIVDTCPGAPLCAHTHKFPRTRSARFNGVGQDIIEGLQASTVKLNLDNSIKRTIPSHVTHCPLDACGDETWVGNYAYLHVVQSSAEYIGCAIAHGHFKDDKERPEKSYMNCHITHYTEVGQPVYNLTPPALETGFTNLCGCPPFYREVEGCLCEYYAPITASTPPYYAVPQALKHKLVRGPPDHWANATPPVGALGRSVAARRPTAATRPHDRL